MAGKSSKNGKGDKPGKKPRAKSDVDKFLKDAAGLDTAREKQIGQHIGYRYDVNLLPDYDRLTPFLKDYMEFMGWDDLNWLEDVHMGYEAGQARHFRPQHQWLGADPEKHEAARQSAGPRHAGARAVGPFPDVAQASSHAAEQGLSEVLDGRASIRPPPTSIPA